MFCCHCGIKYPNRICKHCERIETGIINQLVDKEYQRQKDKNLKIYRQSYSELIIQFNAGITTKEQFEADVKQDVKKTLRALIIKQDDDLIKKKSFGGYKRKGNHRLKEQKDSCGIYE